MVWGAINATGKSNSVIVHGNLIANMYINNCLRLHLVPLIHQLNNNMTFQHDNTPPHFAIGTQNFFAQNNINPKTGKGGFKRPPMFFSAVKNPLGVV